MTGNRSVSHRLTVFTTANAVYGVLGALLAAAGAGLVFRELGSRFGAYALVTAATLRLNLLDDSVGSYLITRCSLRRRAANGLIDAKIGAAFLVAFGAAIVFALGVAAAVSLMFHADAEAWRLGLLAGAGVLCTSAANWGARWLEGYERYPLLRTLQTAGNLGRLAGIAWIVQRGDANVSSLIAWYVASYALVAVPLLALGRRVSGLAIIASMRSARRPDIGEVFRFAKPLLFARGGAVVSYRLDLWLVQGILGDVGTAAYAMADALAQVLTQALETFKVLLPISVNAWRGDDAAWVRRFVLGTSKACVFVMGSICLVTWVNLDVLMTSWFGVMPAATAIAAQLLIAFVALTSLRTPVQTILIGRGRFDVVERSFLVAAGINILTSILATIAFGAWGPAFGTLVSGLYLLAVVFPAASTALHLDRGLLGRVVTGIAPLAGALAISFLIDPFVPSGMALGIAVRTSVALAAYVTAFWLIALGDDERSWLRARLSFGGTQ